MLLDDPTSSAPPLQRAQGRISVTVRLTSGETRLHRLYQDGCGKLRMPKQQPGAPFEAVLINTAGGLTGGDRLLTRAEVGAGASATITTQACERIYRSTGDTARVESTLTVASGGRLAWLPQETILFDAGRVSRRLEVNLAEDAEFLAVEALILGRRAMGETVRSGAFHDRWRIRRDGRLLFADDLRIEGAISDRLSGAAALGGRTALATVLYSGPDPERWLEPVRDRIGPDGGASAWNGKLLARLCATDGLALRRRLEPVLTLMLGSRTLPRVWRS